MKVLKFGATWCGPCKTYHTILEEVKNDLPEGVEIMEYDVDSDEATELLSKYSIRSVPTTIFENEDGSYEKVTGIIPKEDFLNRFK